MNTLTRRTRRLAYLCLSFLLLLTAGCMEERDTLTVYPNGAGTIHLQQKFSKEVSDMMTSFSPEGKKTETIENQFYKDLAKWHGIAAWAPVKAVLENGRITYEATGYFEDAASLKKINDENGADSFTWTAAPDGGFRFAWISSSKKAPTLDEISDQKDEQMSQVLVLFKSLKIEHVAILPGAVKNCTGCAEYKDRSASSVITGDDVIKYFALMKDYKKRVADNQITAEKANAELASKLPSLNLNITAASGDVSKEFEQFKKDLQKAKADYAASGVAEKIQKAAASPEPQ